MIEALIKASLIVATAIAAAVSTEAPETPEPAVQKAEASQPVRGWIDDPAWSEEVRAVVDQSARKYRHDGHYALNYEDMRGELWMRLSKTARLEDMYARGDRDEFFRFCKTVVNNRCRTLLRQHAAKKRHSDTVSIDDVMHTIPQELDSDGEMAGWISDISTLTPFEQLVLAQLAEPSEAALLLAQFETRGHKPRKVVVKIEHHAVALGVSLTEFNNALNSAKTKIMAYTRSTEDVEYNRALATLEEAFAIHVPASLPPQIVARLLTIAARDNFDAITNDVTAALRTVGAKVPELSGGTLKCFGVLYHPKERACSACGLRVACATEAAQFGLGDIHISPGLLGSLSPRIPSIVPRADDNMPSFASARDELLWGWLTEHLELSKHRSEFRFSTIDGTTIFVINANGHISFENAGGVASELSARDGKYYLPDTATIDDAVELFNVHITDRVTTATAP